MFLNYPRESAHVDASQWTLEKALEVAGVTGFRHREILNATHPDLIRESFMKWNVEKRMMSHIML